MRHPACCIAARRTQLWQIGMGGTSGIMLQTLQRPVPGVATDTGSKLLFWLIRHTLNGKAAGERSHSE